VKQPGGNPKRRGVKRPAQPTDGEARDGLEAPSREPVPGGAHADDKASKNKRMDRM
jgi:hypothetical protein